MSIKNYNREFWTAFSDAFIQGEPEMWDVEFFEGALNGCILREQEEGGVVLAFFGSPTWNLLDAKRALRLATEAGARSFDAMGFCVFLVSFIAPEVEVFHAAMVVQGQILRVVETSQGFVCETSMVSLQEIVETRPGDRTQAAWNTIHQAFSNGLLVQDNSVFGSVTALFAALPAALPAQRRTHVYEFGNGTCLRLAGQPDLPIREIRLRYATEARVLGGATNAHALAALAQDWAFG